MRLWRWLTSPCLFGHQPRVFERGPGDVLLLVCPRCRDKRRVRFGEMVAS
jgi:hypothetical protein